MTSIRKLLYDRYVSTHASYDASQTRLALTRQVCPRLPKSRSARILDIGCGAGDLLALLQASGYEQTRGVDISPEQVARATERGVRGVQAGDLLASLEAEHGTLDAVVALDVLEHFDVQEVLRILHAAAHALRPTGGVLIARVPNATSPFFGRYRYGDLTHELAFTSSSLGQALRASGFVTTRFASIEPLPHSLASFARWLLWQLISAALKGILSVETGRLRGHIVTQNMMVVAKT